MCSSSERPPLQLHIFREFREFREWSFFSILSYLFRWRGMVASELSYARSVRLFTLTTPTCTPFDPGEAMRCVPSDAYGLGVTAL